MSYGCGVSKTYKDAHKALQVERTGLHIRGRAAKLEDPGVQNAIVQALGLGATMKQACAIAGVTYRTFLEWRHRAEAEEEPYMTFFDQLGIAADKAIMRKLAVIDQAAQAGTWQAAAWWLERNFPDLYALRTKNEITGKGGEPVKVVLEWPS